jgi:hypothetical protein
LEGSPTSQVEKEWGGADSDSEEDGASSIAKAGDDPGGVGVHLVFLAKITTESLGLFDG